MRIFRYKEKAEGSAQLAVLFDQGSIYSLPQRNFMDIIRQAKDKQLTPGAFVNELVESLPPLNTTFEQLSLALPLDSPEIWAAGVTYQRSREARNYEATEGRMDQFTFYDKVYDAPRPELFMKSTPLRMAGPGEEVNLRSDSHWQIPEPELGVVLSSAGEILGYTAGNDLSCRDIEGDNPLYLPQAKIWNRSCSIGPAVRLAESVADPYQLTICCRIWRAGQCVFTGQSSTSQFKRTLDELIGYLIRDNVIYDGTVLLTGTSIVPPNDFTLAHGDLIEIEIDGIGVLSNKVFDPLH